MSSFHPYRQASLMMAILTTIAGAYYFNSVSTEILPPSDLHFSEIRELADPLPPLPVPPPPPTHPYVDAFICIKENMPLFPGCESLESYNERKQCADKHLLTFIYENIQYPPRARDVGIEGMAVISFVVEKDGTITEARIVRDPGGGTGAEALRVVELMNDQSILWEPGRQMDKPVRVQFNLPVKFKLD